jgi:acetyltransferase-like isoleucine patch superfamily enzyme
MPTYGNLRRYPWRLRYQFGARLLSSARRVLIQATHQHCHVEFQGPVRIGPGFQLYIPRRGTFVVGPGVEFRRGFVCEIAGDGRVEIGPRTVFTSHVLLQCSTSIEIGADCAVGQSVLIVDGYHRYGGSRGRPVEQGYDFRPIRLAEGASISDKCTVQADVGERAIVASNSVVHRPIPAYCLAIGSPARVVRYFGPAEKRPTETTARARRRTSDRYLSSESDTSPR